LLVALGSFRVAFETRGQSSRYPLSTLLSQIVTVRDHFTHFIPRLQVLLPYGVIFKKSVDFHPNVTARDHSARISSVSTECYRTGTRAHPRAPQAQEDVAPSDSSSRFASYPPINPGQTAPAPLALPPQNWTQRSLCALRNPNNLKWLVQNDCGNLKSLHPIQSLPEPMSGLQFERPQQITKAIAGTAAATATDRIALARESWWACCMPKKHSTAQ